MSSFLQTHKRYTAAWWASQSTQVFPEYVSKINLTIVFACSFLLCLQGWKWRTPVITNIFFCHHAQILHIEYISRLSRQKALPGILNQSSSSPTRRDSGLIWHNTAQRQSCVCLTQPAVTHIYFGLVQFRSDPEFYPANDNFAAYHVLPIVYPTFDYW